MRQFAKKYFSFILTQETAFVYTLSQKNTLFMKNFFLFYVLF